MKDYDIDVTVIIQPYWQRVVATTSESCQRQQIANALAEEAKKFVPIIEEHIEKLRVSSRLEFKDKLTALLKAYNISIQDCGSLLNELDR
jgi:hypothetical protein